MEKNVHFMDNLSLCVRERKRKGGSNKQINNYKQPSQPSGMAQRLLVKLSTKGSLWP